MKYKNKKTEINGIIFDSQLEANYYLYLLEQKKMGDVVEIQLQPSFELIPNFRKGKRSIRKMCYIADFRVIYQDGAEVIIDVKTVGTMTKEFRLKWKLFDYFYPTTKLVLITRVGSNWIELPIKKAKPRKQKNHTHK